LYKITSRFLFIVTYISSHTVADYSYVVDITTLQEIFYYILFVFFSWSSSNAYASSVEIARYGY